MDPLSLRYDRMGRAAAPTVPLRGNDAELWRKGSITPDAAAQQIRSWTHNHSLQVDGGRLLDLSTLGARTTP